MNETTDCPELDTVVTKIFIFRLFLSLMMVWENHHLPLGCRSHMLIMAYTINIHKITSRSYQKPWMGEIQKKSNWPSTSHHSFFNALVSLGLADYTLKILPSPFLSKSFKVSLYPPTRATVRTGHGTKDWFQIGKGVRQGCILSPCLFNLYAECIMRNAGLDEAQAGINISRRNVNNLRYADDTTLMAESEEELKSFWIKVKRGEWKSWLKTQHSKN